MTETAILSKDSLSLSSPKEAKSEAILLGRSIPAWAITAGKALLFLAGVLAVASLVRSFIRPDPARAAWTLQVVLAVVALLSALWEAFYRDRTWESPRDRLKLVLTDALGGNAPIEELSTIHGGLEPVIPALQELLREVKRSRHELSQLKQEMSQRVASRTDALERQVGSLRAQATRDKLTGLYNRRMLDEYLARIVQECRLARSHLCVLMIDVDNFKELNDTLGHAAGDELLRSLGQLIRSAVRDHDAAFRYGGDEFVILMPGAPRTAGESLARRLGTLTDALCKPLKVTKPPRMSIGISTIEDLTSPDAKPTDLIEIADRSLYTVKVARKSSRSARSDERAA